MAIGAKQNKRGNTSALVIHDYFPIESLLDPEQLEPYGIPHELKSYEIHLKNSNLIAGRLTFLRHDFRPIQCQKSNAVPLVDLCSYVSSVLGFDVCAACPMRDSKTQPVSDASVRTTCGAGCVERTTAAIRANGRIVGYVRGPDLPTERLFNSDPRLLSAELGRDLVQNRQALDLISRDLIDQAVSRIARRLERRCELERRLKIIRHIRTRIVKATTEEDVRDAGFMGLEALFGRVDISLYTLTDKGTLHLEDARGPNEQAQPEAMSHELGHVGRVIHNKKPKYAQDLKTNPDGFIQSNLLAPALSAYTVPLLWGAEEKPAALQASSGEPDRFRKADRQMVQAVADMMSMGGVRIALRQNLRRIAVKNVGIGRWADCIMQAIAAPTGNLEEILKAKRSLMKDFVEEALRIAVATNTALHVFDADAQALHLAACKGPEWNEQTKATPVHLDVPSAAWQAIKTGAGFYLEDVTGQSNFLLNLKDTKSVYAIPFRSMGTIAGVLTVQWSQEQRGNSPPGKEELLRLVQQFEHAFEFLESRKTDIQHKLVETLANWPTLSKDFEKFAKETVGRIKAAFGVRGCSLFLVLPGQNLLRLIATSGPMPDTAIWYAPGEGLTGGVLRTRKSLRLRDANDEEELHGINAELRAAHKWPDNIEYQSSRKWTESVEYRDAKGKRAFLAAPMIAYDGHAIGVIRMTIKNDLSSFSAEEQTYLEQIAHDLAVAIDDGWKSETKAGWAEVAQEIEHLHGIGLSFAVAPDVNSILQKLLATAITVSKLRGGVVRLAESGGLVLMASQGSSAETLPPELSLNPYLKRGLEAEGAVYVPDVRVDPLWKQVCEEAKVPLQLNFADGARTEILIPVRLKERSIGLVLLESADVVEVPERVLRSLDVLAGYAAVGIELARMKVIAKPMSMVGDMMSGYLHETRKGFGVVRNHANQIKGALAGQKEYTDRLDAMLQEIRGMEDLCMALFPFATTSKMEMRSVRLDELVSETCVDYDAILRGKVDIETNLKGSVTVQANRQLLRSVFDNLIRNAIDAMPRGGLLRVSVVVDEGTPKVLFEDNGHGMDFATTQRIWESTWTTKKEGWGIELAFVRAIMILHRGFVYVDSEVNKGTTFTLVFPKEGAPR